MSKVILGDCRTVLARMIVTGQTVDSIVTDPPYHLSTAARFGKPGAAPARSATFNRMTEKFAGGLWDDGAATFDPALWRLCLAVLKPGGHMVAFGSPRTYHRLASSIEAAGFEIRDQLLWIYGTGFPKSHDQGQGRGTALKPAHEPIVLARKPLIGTVAANLERYGTGAINVDACRNDTGRFPANVTHDGILPYPYFYCAKASATDRNGSRHPTVKPIALIKWLATLVTPYMGVALDPFAGSGTLAAAWSDTILIERDPQFYMDCLSR